MSVHTPIIPPLNLHGTDDAITSAKSEAEIEVPSQTINLVEPPILSPLHSTIVSVTATDNAAKVEESPRIDENEDKVKAAVANPSSPKALVPPLSLSRNISECRQYSDMETERAKEAIRALAELITESNEKAADAPLEPLQDTPNPTKSKKHSKILSHRGSARHSRKSERQKGGFVNCGHAASSAEVRVNADIPSIKLSVETRTLSNLSNSVSGEDVLAPTSGIISPLKVPSLLLFCPIFF